MKLARLNTLLARFPDLTILVVGDYFLDKYLIIEHTLAETSLETGLEAHQVVVVRGSPGAAGTVTSNLRAMDVNVLALGVIGDDGEGYELTRAMQARGVDTGGLIVRSDRFTPTYTKPMLREPDGSQRELNRLDIKNRSPLPAEAEIIAGLRQIVPRVQGVIVADQVPERNCGVVTDRVREEIIALARRSPDKIFAVDSRARIGLFHDVVLKPNVHEALQAIYPDRVAELDRAGVTACGHALYQRAGKPVFLTLGDDGILAFHPGGPTYVPAISVTGPIDIVGAGDATMTGIVAALCAGADAPEAAWVGCLAAAITIQQIGTTGTASRAQIAARFLNRSCPNVSSQ